MQWTADTLDDFVAKSDRLGGPTFPACIEFWAGFNYQPKYIVNQDLEPFGEAYVAEQMRLYEEIAGHGYDVQKSELIDFNLEAHIVATNPYDHPDPATLALHLQRLSRALRYAKPRRGEVLLDLGCGWGLSSELAAYLGLRVIAVDINPSFVRLVNARAKGGGRSISAIKSTFEMFEASEPVDIALFYECLHHAVRPWVVLDRVASQLRPGGRVVLAGEPINTIWWKHWGMRLDPISIYCIRKFGWFESGWSSEFVQRALQRSGFVCHVFGDDSPEVGIAIVGEKQNEFKEVPGNLIPELFRSTGCSVDTGWLILTGAGVIDLAFPSDCVRAVIKLSNFRGRELSARFTSNGAILLSQPLASGAHTIDVPRSGEITPVSFEVEGWVPDVEIHNGDGRTLGVHLESVSFRPH